jgi:hypothetical protein
MAKGDLFSMMRDRYATLDAAHRKRIIREMVSESAEKKKFIQKHFPEFFAEAFPPPNSARRPSKSRAKPRRKRTTKRR